MLRIENTAWSASRGRLSGPSFPYFWGQGGSILEGKPKILRIENKRDLPQGEGSEAPPSPISEGRGRGVNFGGKTKNAQNRKMLRQTITVILSKFSPLRSRDLCFQTICLLLLKRNVKWSMPFFFSFFWEIRRCNVDFCRHSFVAPPPLKENC